MHRLSHLIIKNFRACKNVSLPLESYTPLVGQNNAGKSTILQAISWVLKPAALSTADFFDPQHPVEAAACIDGITEEVLARIPEQKHRTAIEPYCRNGRLWIRVTATVPGKNSIKKEVWNIVQCPGDDVPEHWRDYPTGLPQAVSVLLPDPLVVQAMHDIGEDLGKAKAGTTIKGLLDEIMGPLLNTHAELNNALDTIRHILTAGGDHRSDHLQQFDPLLRRKSGEPLEKSLFEKVYQKEFNELEKNTAWYLDESQCVYWWHRIAVNQRSYGLQGWQRHRVYPDLLACVHGAEDGKFRFSVLETKGDHLKGNDDTEYKRRLFELLTRYADVTASIGQLALEDQGDPMRFRMVMEKDWKEALVGEGIR